MVSSDKIRLRLEAKRTGQDPEDLQKTQVSYEPGGYLVCEQCGSFYELQPGESPEDFSLECDCGGKIIYQESLETYEESDIFIIKYLPHILIIFSLGLALFLYGLRLYAVVVPVIMSGFLFSIGIGSAYLITTKDRHSELLYLLIGLPILYKIGGVLILILGLYLIFLSVALFSNGMRENSILYGFAAIILFLILISGFIMGYKIRKISN